MNSKKILLLEDELLVSIDIDDLLTAQGYKVMTAKSSQEALTNLTTFKPQLAICDIDLGEGPNGIEAAKQMQKLNRGLEVIFLTAFSDPVHQQQAFETNPLNYIVKPFTDEQLLVAVSFAFRYLQKKEVDSESLSQLSLSEYSIVEMISRQLTSREIADELNVSEKTIRNHRYNISKKLSIPEEHNSLMKWAIKNI